MRTRADSASSQLRDLIRGGGAGLAEHPKPDVRSDAKASPSPSSVTLSSVTRQTVATVAFGVGGLWMLGFALAGRSGFTGLYVRPRAMDVFQYKAASRSALPASWASVVVFGVGAVAAGTASDTEFDRIIWVFAIVIIVLWVMALKAFRSNRRA